MKNDWVQNVGVFIGKKFWIENSLSQLEGVWQGRAGPSRETGCGGQWPTWRPLSLPNLSSYLPAYEDGTNRVFQNVRI